MAWAAPGAGEPATPRVEARSSDLLAVGVVADGRMSIHLSRLADNAPVRDATVTVLLRGTLLPTVAEPDGSYSLRTKDLELPGSAVVQFQVTQGQSREDLQGELAVGDGQAKPEEKNGARQLGWWVLNFAVCIGFLLLLSRRSKAAKAREAASHE